ncbi:ATP-grasp domain-containing protein [Actinophytocola sp.]|uniref:ATP-grasp domain-containing protein n=1 Tax=Actinophytocola sp. TaxID=1872138 RepID=UPI003899FF99
MTARSVVVVDPYSSGNLFAAALREHGYVPVCVTTGETPPEIYLSSYRPADFDAVHVFRGDPTSLAAELRHLSPVAVIPGAETGVELADTLAAALTPDRANVPATTSARRHKGEMARVVSDSGLPALRTLCTSDGEEASAWLVRVGLADSDIVLKPPRSGGGNGFTLVPAGTDWRPAFDALLRTPDQYGNLDGEVVVQEYAAGVEYAVDTVSQDGGHAVTAICRYGKTRNATHAAVYESIEFLPFGLPGHPEVCDFVRKALDALGVRFGAAHTEVMVTADGPRLIEVGCRIAGGGLPDACRLATGESPVDRVVRCVEGALGRQDFDLELPVVVAFLVARDEGVATNAEVFQGVRSLASYCGGHIGFRTGEYVASTADLITTMRSGWVLLGNHDRMRLLADYQAVRDIERTFIIEGEPAS